MDFHSEVKAISSKTQNLAVFGPIFAEMADFCRGPDFFRKEINIASFDAK